MAAHWAQFMRLGMLCAACAFAMQAVYGQADETAHQHSHAAQPAEHQHRHELQAASHDHQHHEQPAPGYARRTASYRLPQATLVRSDGTTASFPQEIDDGKPVLLNFIYTTCTAVCPILAQTFSELQRSLGAERDKIHMVSISIDPEEDTPQRLAEYAKRFEAGRQWTFYTGTVKDSLSMQRAFQAYFGDKMHHRPMTFMRGKPGEPWVRLEGYTTPEELLAEYRQLVAAPKTASR